MALWYHWTTPENAEAIAREGFRAGTCFATSPTAANHPLSRKDGGGVLLTIDYPYEPTKYQWHWGMTPHIPPEYIVRTDQSARKGSAESS